MRDAATGEATAGAHIRLLVAGTDSTVTGAIADERGRFAIETRGLGLFDVAISHIGYEKRRLEKIELTAGKIVQLTILLKPSVLRLGETVVISASRRREKVVEAPAAVHVIESDRLQTTLTPGDHLLAAPAVDIIHTGLHQSQVAVRGFNGVLSSFEKLLLLKDHRIASTPATRFSIYELIPMQGADLERLEVVAGPGSALYGPNAENGVVHFITKSPFASRGTQLSVGAGERNVLLGSLRHAGVAGETLGYRVSAQLYRGTDWKFFNPAEPDSVVRGIVSPEGRTDVGGLVDNRRDQLVPCYRFP